MFFLDFNEEAFKEAMRDEGREEGRDETTLTHISSLISRLKISAKEAMDLLNIPEAEQDKYMDKV